jgi:hypothetical protein
MEVVKFMPHDACLNLLSTSKAMAAFLNEPNTIYSWLCHRNSESESLHTPMFDRLTELHAKALIRNISEAHGLGLDEMLAHAVLQKTNYRIMEKFRQLNARQGR